MSASTSKTTTDHDEIRTWVEERKGRPSVVKATESGDLGLLRIDFGKKEEAFDELSWDDFFRIFEESKLAFLYQDKTKDGKIGRFFKFVKR